MTEKELRKLNRYELLEMLLAQSRKMERLERELAEANEKLNKRQRIVASSGTMAEAALRLNGVFEAADHAAEEYLSNIRLIADGLISDARHKAAHIITNAERQAQMNAAASEENDDPREEDKQNGGTGGTVTGGVGR